MVPVRGGRASGVHAAGRVRSCGAKNDSNSPPMTPPMTYPLDSVAAVAGTRQIQSLHATAGVSPIEAGHSTTRALQKRAPAQSAPGRSGAPGCLTHRSGLAVAGRPTDSGSQRQPARQIRAAAGCTRPIRFVRGRDPIDPDHFFFSPVRSGFRRLINPFLIRLIQ